jgi:mRNA-degrading endonuclease toxin of MazEF toxin-antitoxin module
LFERMCHPAEVITVSVTTKRRRSETLVELHAGDHPFITHESVISYAYAKVRTVEEIEAAIRSGEAKQREPVSADILRRVCNGLVESDFTPNDVRHFYRTAMQDS